MLGGIDLVRALSLADIRSTVVAGGHDPVCYSRAVERVLEPSDAVSEQKQLLDTLLSFAAERPQPTALYYDNDWDLLFVSRNREPLRAAFRFVVPDAHLVETLVDKASFQELAQRLDLPVPRARRWNAASGEAPDVAGLRYPLVVKPLIRHPDSWRRLTLGKALMTQDEAVLRRLVETLQGSDLELMIQELVAGPESRIESYHVYVDADGQIAGEFTGEKIRTYPADYGFSSAVTITDSDEVRTLGRELAGRLELRGGVAKFDFKRGDDDRLLLLEINPRFNLWHHPGAAAGVNLPALVHADLLGRPRPGVSAAKAGVTWVHLAWDPKAAREGVCA
ncbi:hypothetical protein BH20ACT16_BH20ACT16_06810 [soil metagenome]